MNYPQRVITVGRREGKEKRGEGTYLPHSQGRKERCPLPFGLPARHSCTTTEAPRAREGGREGTTPLFLSCFPSPPAPIVVCVLSNSLLPSHVAHKREAGQ